VAEGVDRLGDLARSLEDRLVSAGWPRDERPFRAHLTLARSDGVAAGPTTARALVAAADAFRAEWTADRLILFESHTGGGPARYEALSEFSLEG
jgi:2'-5' RNA ligase